jgi:alpha-aminoadipic semialdehyde synthase
VHERLLVVADISCDVNGSIEFLERSTTIDKPFFQYDPVTGQEVSDDIEGRGITMMGVDILPSELPVDSSNHFGNALTGVVEEFLHAQALDGRGIDLSKLSDRLVSLFQHYSIIAF